MMQQGQPIETMEASKKERIDRILLENQLVCIETGFFRGKTNVTRVRDTEGRHCILKTGGIDRYQSALFHIAKDMEGSLSFRVPAVLREGSDWMLFEEIVGEPLDVACAGDLDRYVALSDQLAREYQSVLEKLIESKALGSAAGEGREWTRSRLEMWSQPLVEAGLIEPSVVDALRTECEAMVQSKGEGFFGWAHGNIISDHVLMSQGKLYLLDVCAVSRPGRGYYDFLRALDFLLLKSDDACALDDIPRWMKQYLSAYDEVEMRLVFAFRVMGILGWDIVHERVEYAYADIASRQEDMLRYIRREYA